MKTKIIFLRGDNKMENERVEEIKQEVIVEEKKKMGKVKKYLLIGGGALAALLAVGLVAKSRNKGDIENQFQLPQVDHEFEPTLEESSIVE
jgi:hypothetical protein